MKVYTVIEYNYDDTNIFGVFKSKDEAQLQIQKYTDGTKHMKPDKQKHAFNFHIEEWEV